MKKWIVTLAALAAMTGSIAAQTNAELQEELNQVKSDLLSVRARLAEIEQAEGGAARTGAAMRRDLEALAGKVGIFDVSIGATLTAQHATHLSKNYTTLFSNVVEAHDPTMPSPVIAESTALDTSATLDIALAANLMPGASAYINVEVGEGGAIEDQTGVNTLAGVNRDIDINAPNGQLTLSELWYRHSWDDDFFSLTVGKINFRRVFDKNAAADDEDNLFLANPFVDNMTIGYPHAGLDLATPGVTPYYDDLRDSPGFVMRWNFAGMDPVRNWYIMAGGADGDANYGNVWRDGFGIIEAGVALELVPGLLGNYRGYVWANAADHADIRPGGSTNKTGSGGGVSFDQQLSDNVTAFLRWGMRDDKVYIVDHAYSFGVLYGGDLWQRNQDALGFAANVAMVGNRAKDAVRSRGYDASDEVLMELFYRCQVNEYVALSPNVQFIRNPGGKSGRSDITVLGLRARVDF